MASNSVLSCARQLEPCPYVAYISRVCITGCNVALRETSTCMQSADSIWGYCGHVHMQVDGTRVYGVAIPTVTGLRHVFNTMCSHKGAA